MPSIADLVEEPQLRRLALPATITEGRVLAEQGSVKLEKFGPLEVTGTVADTNSVELRTEGDALAWSCTCPAGHGSELCAHTVAVALETWGRSPVRRK